MKLIGKLGSSRAMRRDNNLQQLNTCLRLQAFPFCLLHHLARVNNSERQSYGTPLVSALQEISSFETGFHPKWKSSKIFKALAGR